MSTVLPASAIPSRLVTYGWPLLALAAVALAAAMQSGSGHMVSIWLGRDEYSHALLIPFVAAYLIWQQRAALASVVFQGSWLGAALVMFGIALQVAGTFAALDVVQQYGLLISIYGLVLALLGLHSSARLWAPLLMLALMIPLPEFLLQNFSAQLQLISSQIGVWFVRLFGISVFVEGNVIDLGTYKLQVAEACDGLRYLFPLMTLSFIMAYFFRVSMWKRVLLFLSSIPITILMNSLRIGTIGVMVEHWGVRMAEGFLHEFQGWAVFMVSAALMLGEMMLLAKVGRDSRPWREAFGLDAPASVAANAPPARRSIPGSFILSSVAMVLFAAAVMFAPQRTQAIPVREQFISFPNQFDAWTGKRDALERIYLDALQLDDYIMADYLRGPKDVVNFYVAWYDSQKAGQSAHSPRSCLPGGGWRITQLDQRNVAGVTAASQPLRVNRAVIELGPSRQVVYYWFQQRGRIITNEYMVKWYLFWDAFKQQRSDGALVRLTSMVRAGETPADADRRLTEFAAQVAPRLDRYVPD